MRVWSRLRPVSATGWLVRPILLFMDDRQRFDQLSNDEIAALPLDRLALLVLADAKETDAWNWRNWILEWQQRSGSSGHDPASLAVAEAWGWLFTRALVGPGPQSNFDLHGINITRAGDVALEHGLPFVRAMMRLDVELKPVLEWRVRPQFMLADYELAAFAAMREVEISVRTRARLPADLIGVKLMRKAFGTQGPLWSEELDPGESVAQMDLFAGAIGLFKNPPSHRKVDYSDPTQAAEVILLADLLLRLLDAGDSPRTD
jgi:uncharacterized protein (TIGR02391 family)